MAWVEKDHSDHVVPTPCYMQGRQPPHQAAQSHIQPGLECLQGWGIRSLLGQCPLPNAPSAAQCGRGSPPFENSSFFVTLWPRMWVRWER